MSSKQGKINAKMRDSKLVEFTCTNCGEKYTITYGAYRKKKDKYFPLCKR